MTTSPLRAPDFVAAMDELVAEEVGPCEGASAMARRVLPSLPARSGCASMELGNRMVLSPMCQYSAQGRSAGRLAPDALRLARHWRAGPDLHRDDLTSPRTRASRRAAPGSIPRRAGGRPGSASSISSMRNSRHKFCLQLGHAGRKGATQADVGRHRPTRCAEGAWPIVSASPLPYYPHSQSAARNDPRRHGPTSATTSWRR